MSDARASSLPRYAVAVLGALLLACCGPAPSAGAKTYCVHLPSPCAIGSTKATIQAALDAANGNGEEDTVLIGAGGSPYMESPNYFGTEAVHVIGAGVGETVVASDGSRPTTFTLTNAASTIEGLTIEAGNTSGAVGLQWNGAARDLEVLQPGPPQADTAGIVAEDGATMSASRVDVEGFQALRVKPGAQALIAGTTIRSAGIGASVDTEASLVLRRASVTAPRAGVTLGNGGLASATIENSVLHHTGSIYGDGAIFAASDTSVVARHTTIVGAGAGAGIYATASYGPSSITIHDSIVENFGDAMRCGGENGEVATIGVAHSNWTDPVLAGTGCNFTNGAGNSAVVPGFAAPFIGDYHLSAPSPLIDTADPASPLAEDHDALPRPLDGDGVGGARADMGAFEYQPPPPPVVQDPAPADPAATPGTDGGQPRANPAGRPPETEIIPTLKRAQLARHRAKFRFVSNEAGARFECRLDGKPFAGCGSPRAYGRLKPGSHIFIVRAITAAGPDPSPAQYRFKVGLG